MGTTLSTTPEHAPDELGLERIVFFSDAVIARGHRLVDPRLGPRAIRFGMMRALTPPAVFALSLLRLLVHPYAAMAAWPLIYPVLAALRRMEGPR